MKNILSLIIIAATLILAPTSAQSQKKEKKEKGKSLYTAQFGIAPYTFRKSFPKGLEATLDTIKMLGITEIEGGGGRDVTPEQYKKMCEDRGISIPSTGTGYEALVKDPAAIAARANALGAKYVMVAWIPHKNGSFNFENAKKAVDDFNAAGKVLKENGVTFCYHVHGYEFWPHENGTLLDYIITNTNPEYVSFEMDTGWVLFGGGDPVGLLKKYGSRWKLMHLKDLRKGVKKDLTGLTDGNNDVPLGTGELDVAGVIKEAKKAGVAHYFIEDESNQPRAQVAQTIDYLKSLKD